jgi:integrase
VPKVDVYSREDLELIVATARNLEERLLFLLLADAALRIGECAGLMWKDIRLDERAMVIRRCVTRGQLQETAKGADGEVTLSPRLVEALRGYTPRGDFVFVLRRGASARTAWCACRRHMSKRAPWACACGKPRNERACPSTARTGSATAC